MTRTDRRARWRSALVLISFCLNILLFALLIRASLPPHGRAWAMGTKVAADLAKADPELAMDVYCVRDPFVILVDKAFPRTDSFKVFVYGEPFMIAADAAMDNAAEATKDVYLAFGAEFSIGCTYCSNEDGFQIRSITVDTKGQHLIDLNADGRFDERMVFPKQRSEKPPPKEIWYKGAWHVPVSASGSSLGKHERRLPSGHVVSFDMESGDWVSRE